MRTTEHIPEVEKEPRLPRAEWEPESLITTLLAAAKTQDWDKVNRIAPQFMRMDGNLMVLILGKLVNDADENVRDGVMTAWSFINPTEEVRKRAHFDTAAGVLKSDPHECAAIWAAVSVSRYLEDLEYKRDAKGALAEFKRRISIMDTNEGRRDWQETKDYVVGLVKDRVPDLAKYI